MNAAAPGSTTASTAVRIVSISAAQNKRGKDCYEGGMGAGHFTWYKDMGGNSNWMYLAVTNATDHHVSLALWLLYEAATEPLVDPLCTSGDIQVGFFNQSKNMNRQVPLFELAEESQPMLEMASGEAATLKVRINDLSSHHQNQRFILVAGPADAPIRGSRSVPIEIMSKPRLEDKVKEEKPSRKRASAGDGPASKRAALDVPASTPSTLLAALSAVTDPNPTPQRQADLACTLLSALPAPVKHTVAERLLRSLEKPVKMAIFDKLAADLQLDGGDAQASKKGPRPKFKSLAKAIVEFKRNELGHKRARSEEGVGVLSEDELRSFFVDEGGGSLFDSLSPRTGDA